MQRALALDVRVHLRWSRRDALRNFLAVMRSLMRHADWETLRSRPGHALIAAEAGVSTRTVCTMIDVAHQLGYLATMEVGTTERIRAGRTRGHDPHRGQGNRAQEYRLCVPEALASRFARESRSFHPSRPAFAGQGKTSSSRLREPAGYARARARQGAGALSAHGGGKSVSPGQDRCRRPRPVRRGRRRPPWLGRAADVAAVWRLLPARLTGLLAEHEADRIAAEIARQLDHRTVAELGDRIARHWDYWRYRLGAVRSFAAVAHRMLRRDFDCPDVRCEDGWQLDRGEPCQACEEIARDRAAARRSDAGDEADRPRYSIPGITRPGQDPGGPQAAALPPSAPQVLDALGLRRNPYAPGRASEGLEVFRAATAALRSRTGRAGTASRRPRIVIPAHQDPGEDQGVAAERDLCPGCGTRRFASGRCGTCDDAAPTADELAELAAAAAFLAATTTPNGSTQ